jgi:hypothetical protein
MKKSAFDRRGIVPGSTVIKALISIPNSKKTTKIGLVTEVTDTTVTLIHGGKKDTYNISDLVGISIVRTL